MRPSLAAPFAQKRREGLVAEVNGDVERGLTCADRVLDRSLSAC